MTSPAKPTATVGALVQNPQGLWLIVRTTKWRGTWGVPGGKVEYGERLEDALRREFAEEVALTLTDVRFALVQEAVISPEFHKEAHFILLNYLARTTHDRVTPNEEIVEWAWVTLEDARHYPLNTFTEILIEHAREHA